jgi:hypothetical protein
VPAGTAAGGNEIISEPEFQQKAFSESGYLQMMSGWAGQNCSDGGKPRICYPAGGMARVRRKTGKISYLPTQAD